MGGTQDVKIISEILDMINYQLPPIKDEKLRAFLKIKLEEWNEFIILMDKQFTNYGEEKNKDLIYLRVAMQISLTFSKVNERCFEEGIPKSLMNSFNEIHGIRIEQMINDIRKTCCDESTIEEIRKKIYERIIVYLYQNILNAHKIERIIKEDKV